MLFSLYYSSIYDIARKHGLRVHLYADVPGLAETYVHHNVDKCEPFIH